MVALPESFAKDRAIVGMLEKVPGFATQPVQPPPSPDWSANLVLEGGYRVFPKEHRIQFVLSAKKGHVAIESFVCPSNGASTLVLTTGEGPAAREIRCLLPAENASGPFSSGGYGLGSLIYLRSQPDDMAPAGPSRYCWSMALAGDEGFDWDARPTLRATIQVREPRGSVFDDLITFAPWLQREVVFKPRDLTD